VSTWIDNIDGAMNRGAVGVKKKRIYLHIGYGKTGTSSVQAQLWGQRERLLTRGVLYPLAGLHAEAHHLLAEVNVPRMSEYTLNEYKALRREIASSVAHTVVISSEHFCFLPEEYVAEIKALLRQFEVKVIFYVRNQTKLVKSAFLQRQRQGLEYHECAGKFYDIHRDSFDFMHRIRPWVKNFGEENIIARLYDRRIIGDDTCADFLKLIGIRRLAGYESKRVNESLIPEFSVLVTIMDGLNMDKESRDAMIAELLFLSEQFRPNSTRRLLYKGNYDTIQVMHTESNREFAEQFLSPEEADLFLNQRFDDE
jgi:hypothetical protein